VLLLRGELALRVQLRCNWVQLHGMAAVMEGIVEAD
jgi:hypothetical protein